MSKNIEYYFYNYYIFYIATIIIKQQFGQYQIQMNKVQYEDKHNFLYPASLQQSNNLRKNSNTPVYQIYQPFLTTCDIEKQYRVLQSIIQAAEIKYIQEEQFRKCKTNSSFNILRVLTAYKQHFPELAKSESSEVYNIVVKIMQKYKPQSPSDWYQAINSQKNEEIGRLKTVHGHSKISYYMKTKGNNSQLSVEGDRFVRYLNDSKSQIYHNAINPISKASTRSKSSANSKFLIKSFIQNCPHKKNYYSELQRAVSQQDECSTFSKCINNSKNQTQKNHYVSFEPYHYDTNKENTSSNRYNGQNIYLNENYQTKDNVDLYQCTTSNMLSNSFVQNCNKCLSVNVPRRVCNRLDRTCQCVKPNYNYSEMLRHNENSYCCVPSKTRNMSSQLLPGRWKNKQQTPIATSKVTLNTKQITEYCESFQDQINNVSIERADYFYKVNTYTKTFSILLANFSAYQQYRQNVFKANLFRNNELKMKAFVSWVKVKELIKKDRKICKEMQQYRNTKTKKNIFSIFKILYETKVSNQTNRARKLKEKGPTIMTIQFIISLISNQLQQEKQNYSNQNTNRSNFEVNTKNYQKRQTPRALPDKAQYFKQTGQLGNFHKLLNHFSGFRPTLSQIKNIYALLDKKIQQKYLKIWIKNYKAKKNFFNKISKLNLKKAFNSIKRTWARKQQLDRIQISVRTVRQHRLMNNGFKGLLQSIYSTKIMAKRISIIIKTHENNKKEQLLKLWSQQTKLKILHKKQQIENMRKFQILISNIYIARVFELLKKCFNCEKQDEKKMQIQKQLQLQKIVMQIFKENIAIKKNTIDFKNFLDNAQKKHFIKKLKQNHIEKISVKKVQKVICQQSYLKFFKNCKKVQQVKRQQQQSKHNTVKQFFHLWKDQFIKHQTEMNHKSNDMQNSFNVINSKCFFDKLKSNCKKMHIKQKEKELYVQTVEYTDKNKQKVKPILLISKQIDFFTHLKQLRKRRKQIDRKSQILASILQQKLLKYNLNIFRNNCSFEVCQQKLQKYVTQKKQQCLMIALKQERIKSKFNKLKLKKNKKIQSNIFKCFTQRITVIKSANDKAINHYKLSTTKKILISIAYEIIATNNKINNLQKFIIQNRKQQCLKNFTKNYNQKIHTLQQQKLICFTIIKSRLMKNKVQKEKNKAVSKYIIDKKCHIFCEKLQQFKQFANQQKTYDQNTKKLQLTLRTSLFLGRLNRFFIYMMLLRKQEFMALKFRTTKLCSKAIQALANQFEKQHGIKLREYITINTRNLSTNYDSIQ